MQREWAVGAKTHKLLCGNLLKRVPMMLIDRPPAPPLWHSAQLAQPDWSGKGVEQGGLGNRMSRGVCKICSVGPF